MFSYISVDVDFRGCLAGEADELAGVQLPDHHLPRLLHHPAPTFYHKSKPEATRG